MKESPTGRSPREPELQRLPARTQEARDIVAAFRKSHQPQIDCFCIDFAQLELLVLANLTEEEKAKLKREIYGEEKEDGAGEVRAALPEGAGPGHDSDENR